MLSAIPSGTTGNPLDFRYRLAYPPPKAGLVRAVTPMHKHVHSAKVVRLDAPLSALAAHPKSKDEKNPAIENSSAKF